MSRLTWTTKHSFNGMQHLGKLGQLTCAFVSGETDRFTVEVTLGGKDRDRHFNFADLETAKDEAERRVAKVLSLAGLLEDGKDS
jgi:hypothetical protein